MRVLIITWEYPPNVVGGMGKHVAELVPALASTSLEDGPLQIDVLTARYAGGPAVERFDDNTTIHRIDMPSIDPLDLYNSVVANNAWLIEGAQTLAHRSHYDLIHIHDWLVGEVGIQLKHAWKTPLVTTIHATERGRHQGHLPSFLNYQIDRMEWRTCFEAWRIIVCSSYMLGELRDYFSTPDDKIAVIPNGIVLPRAGHCDPAERQKLRQHFAPNGEPLLFFVGRIVYEKGLHVLLSAMPLILAKYPSARLLIAGRNSQDLLPLARSLRIDHAVEFLGFISNRERDCIYQVVDAAVFPSIYEPFGIVALEAMAMNCNVIVSNVGGLSEVVRHMQTGLTVYPNDPASVAWAVDQIFTFPNLAKQLRRWAAYDVRTYYNWSYIARQTAQLYSRVAAERHLAEW